MAMHLLYSFTCTILKIINDYAYQAYYPYMTHKGGIGLPWALLRGATDQ
jgi:hypothetical protein